MEVLAAELGVPVEVLLHRLPQRLQHASDGVILLRSARLGSRFDYLRVRNPQLSVDVLRPQEPTPSVRAHVMPYMPLKDACAIYLALQEEEGGPSTSYHRRVIISNPEVLYAKFLAYRSITDQADLLDRVSESVEALLTVRMQAQLESCVADQWSALASLREHAWRLVLIYLNEGNILEAKKYLEACFPRVSAIIDDNPTIAFQAYEYLLNELQEQFDGEELDVSVHSEQYLASLASFRLMYLKAKNLGFIIAMVESFVSDMTRKREYLMRRLEIPTLIGASFLQ